MAGITLAQAEARLTEYLTAEATVLTGQSYSIAAGGNARQWTGADIAEIREGIAFWDAKVKELTGSTSGVKRNINMAPSW